ncbi:hypothetical protein BV22DRAFT_1052373, partial [Leucogyrophana mollusca]
MALIALSLTVVAAQSAPIKLLSIVKDQFSPHAAEVVAVAVERGLRGCPTTYPKYTRVPGANAAGNSEESQLGLQAEQPQTPEGMQIVYEHEDRYSDEDDEDPEFDRDDDVGRVAVCIPSEMLTIQCEDDIEGSYPGEDTQANYFAPGTTARPASSSRQQAWRNINPRASTAAASALHRISEGSISSRYGRPRLPTSMRVVPVIAQVPQQRSTSEMVRGEWSEGVIQWVGQPKDIGQRNKNRPLRLPPTPQPPPMQPPSSQAQPSTANSTPAQIPSREPDFTKDEVESVKERIRQLILTESAMPDTPAKIALITRSLEESAVRKLGLDARLIRWSKKTLEAYSDVISTLRHQFKICTRHQCQTGFGLRLHIWAPESEIEHKVTIVKHLLAGRDKPYLHMISQNHDGSTSIGYFQSPTFVNSLIDTIYL